MAYSDIDDQKKTTTLNTIRELVTNDSAESLSDAEVLSRYTELRDEADSEIDSYLEMGGYTVPLTTVPARVRAWSCDITDYRMHKRKGLMPEVVKDTYERVLRSLERIAEGKDKLPVITTSTDAVFASGALITSHFGDE